MTFLTSSHNKSWITKPIYVAIICILFFTIHFCYLKNTYTYTDSVYFGGDSWDYQSIGVNLALGQGYINKGKFAFEVYKFVPDTYNTTWLTHDELYQRFYNDENRAFPLRTPGYPLLLMSIYKIFNVHPIYIKYMQAVFLSLSSIFMITIGYYYWSTAGLICSILASHLFIRYFCPNPTLIMTESFNIFALFLWSLGFMSWEHRLAKSRLFILGILTGVCLLIKSNVFLPLVFLVYLLLKSKHLVKTIGLGTIFILGCCLIIFPWSTYASMKSNKLVILSEQQEPALLDGNNEDVIKTGEWSPGWRKWNKGSKYYLYNRLQDKNLTALQKVLIFLNQNKRHLPKMFFNKLRASFGEPSAFLCLVSMWLYYFLVIVRRRTTQEEKIPIFPLLFFFIISVNTLIAFGLPRYVSAFIPFFILPAVYFPIYLIKSLSWNKMKKP